MRFLLLVLSVIEYLLFVRAARILVLSPMGTKSHTIGIMPLIEALGDRGHQVTLVTPHSHKTRSPNIRKIELNDALEHVEGEWYTFKQENLFNAITMFFQENRKAVTKGYASFVANKDIQKISQTKDVDLIILDCIFNDFTFPIIDHLGVPFIFYSPGSGAFWTLDAMNVDPELASIPPLGLEVPTPMNLLDRSLNVIANKLLLLIKRVFVLWYVDEISRIDFPNSRPAQEVQRNAALCLANIDRATSMPRNLPPTFIPVGAMHCRPAQPLPEELENFAEGAKDGFIVFTLGSNAQVSLMPENIKEMFVRVFARLPQKVIWKWETKIPPSAKLSTNVKIVDWLPQQDLLGHNKARLFITHGGLLGTQESLYHGVPILGIPLGRDQRNVLSIGVQQGVAIKWEWEQLTEEILFDSIYQLINYSSYKGNATRLSRIIKDELMPAKNVGVYWVEHVLRHNGTAHLQSLAAKDMPFYQFYLIDVWAFISCLVITLLYINFKIVCAIVWKCNSKPKVKHH